MHPARSAHSRNVRGPYVFQRMSRTIRHRQYHKTEAASIATHTGWQDGLNCSQLITDVEQAEHFIHMECMFVGVLYNDKVILEKGI